MAEDKFSILEIDRVKNNPYAKVILNGFDVNRISSNESGFLPVPQALEAFLVDDFEFGGSSEYTEPSQGSTLLTEVIQQGAAIINSGISAVRPNAKAIQAPTTRHIITTLSTYSGTDKLRLTIPLLFVATRESDNILESIKQLTLATYPKQFKGGLISAPNNYALTAYSTRLNQQRGLGIADVPSAGGISLSIGYWFKSKQVFLIKNFTSKISKATMESGFPLYAEVSVELESYRVLFADEVIQMISPIDRPQGPGLI